MGLSWTCSLPCLVFYVLSFCISFLYLFCPYNNYPFLLTFVLLYLTQSLSLFVSLSSIPAPFHSCFSTCLHLHFVLLSVSVCSSSPPSRMSTLGYSWSSGSVNSGFGHVPGCLSNLFCPCHGACHCFTFKKGQSTHRWTYTKKSLNSVDPNTHIAHKVFLTHSLPCWCSHTQNIHLQTHRGCSSKNRERWTPRRVLDCAKIVPRQGVIRTSARTWWTFVFTVLKMRCKKKRK